MQRTYTLRPINDINGLFVGLTGNIQSQTANLNGALAIDQAFNIDDRELQAGELKHYHQPIITITNGANDGTDDGKIIRISGEGASGQSIVSEVTINAADTEFVSTLFFKSITKVETNLADNLNQIYHVGFRNKGMSSPIVVDYKVSNKFGYVINKDRDMVICLVNKTLDNIFSSFGDPNLTLYASAENAVATGSDTMNSFEDKLTALFIEITNVFDANEVINFTLTTNRR